MNGHGGKRPGAGRPRGAASRANEEVRQEAAATGELPLAYMLRIMRDPSQPVGRRDDMAKAATTTIPIVLYDRRRRSRAAGIVASLSRPGGNITGVSLLGGSLGPKRLIERRSQSPN